MENRLPRLMILATGGTIAGQAVSSAHNLEYTSGVVGVNELVSAVPQIASYANVLGEQIAKIGSEDMSDEVWLKLAAAANTHLANPEIDGVVVLHGTDTMEETAYFLNLTVKSFKPVVVTGAMRPTNAISADGPANLLNAIRLAAAPETAGKGVLICLDESINAAREATKTSTFHVDTFKSPHSGELGFMTDELIRFYRKPLRRHSADSEFDVSGMRELPRVEIVYGHAGQRRDLIDAAVDAGARGIIHAGVGMGRIHRQAKPALIEAVAKGVVVVCSSRTGSGLVPFLSRMSPGFVTADNLNPQKARVLLQLALTRTSDPSVIQEIFDTY